MRKIAIVVCLVSLAFSACGKNDTPTVDATPKPTDITVVAKEYAFSAEASAVVDSLANVTIKNEGKEPHQAVLIKLAEGKTIDDAKAFFTATTPPPGPPPFSVGGGTTVVEPGASTTVTQALPAGTYAFWCFVPAADGTPHFLKGMTAPITVTGNSTASLPLPDGENATASEYKYDLPPLKAGTTLIRGTNGGTQDHEFQIARVADGKTSDDALNWLTNHQGPPPIADIGGAVVGRGGGSGAFKLTLSKGTYVFYCNVPDDADGRPHVLHGMFQPVTIT